jgi:general secretion pathway protein H
MAPMGSLAAKATMPTLAAGNPKHLTSAGGFTLLELLVVLAIVAFASVGVGFALRDSTQTQLDKEALRLAALLESARARAQASGVVVRWRPTAQGFVFEGLPTLPDGQQALPNQWLSRHTVAQVLDPQRPDGQGSFLVLGPEPLIGAQALRLLSSDQPAQERVLATDGLRPFALRAPSP